MRIKIKADTTKGPLATAAIPLWGCVVGSQDEGRVINEMLFKDLTSHSLMAARWTISLDILRLVVYSSRNRIWLVLKRLLNAVLDSSC